MNEMEMEMEEDNEFYCEPWEIRPRTVHASIVAAEQSPFLSTRFGKESSSSSDDDDDEAEDHVVCEEETGASSKYLLSLDETETGWYVLWLRVRLPAAANVRHSLDITVNTRDSIVWKLSHSLAPPGCWHWQKLHTKLLLEGGKENVLDVKHNTIGTAFSQIWYTQAQDKQDRPPDYEEFPSHFDIYPNRQSETYNAEKPWTAFRVADSFEMKQRLENRIEYVMLGTKHKKVQVESSTVFVLNEASDKIEFALKPEPKEFDIHDQGQANEEEARPEYVDPLREQFEVLHREFERERRMETDETRLSQEERAHAISMLENQAQTAKLEAMEYAELIQALHGSARAQVFDAVTEGFKDCFVAIEDE